MGRDNMNICKYITFLWEGNTCMHMCTYMCAKTCSGGIRKGNNFIFLNSPGKKKNRSWCIFSEIKKLKVAK